MTPQNEECRPIGHGAASTSTITQQPAGTIAADHSRPVRHLAPGDPTVLELLALLDAAHGRVPRHRPEHVDLSAGLVAVLVPCIPTVRAVRRRRLRDARRHGLTRVPHHAPEQVQAA